MIAIAAGRPKGLSVCAASWVALSIVACGGPNAAVQKQWQQRLQDAVHSSVETRQANRDNSRVVQQALDEGALKNLHRHEVRRVLGRGKRCEVYPRCSELGFRADDWLYEVGDGDENQVGKKPVLIVGFGPHGQVTRTWNLRVHE